MAVSKEPYVLLHIYAKEYEGLYHVAPTINKYREKWAMMDVIDSIGFERAKEVLYYYFQTSKSKHPLNFFYNNFERLEDMMIQQKEDKVNRDRLLEQTRKMVQE